MTDIPYDERGYRPCVGIFLLNEANLLFAGRRIDNRAEAWQMPQGGIDHGESVIEACLREMEEEIGTNKAELLREHEEWLHYDIPQPLSDRLWHGKYRGQKQRWVALRFTGTDADINIDTNCDAARPRANSRTAAALRQTVWLKRCTMRATDSVPI